MAKGQDYFCPISQLISKAKIPNPDDVGLWLKVRRSDLFDHGVVFAMLFCMRSLTPLLARPDRHLTNPACPGQRRDAAAVEHQAHDPQDRQPRLVHIPSLHARARGRHPHGLVDVVLGCGLGGWCVGVADWRSKTVLYRPPENNTKSTRST